MPPLVTMTGACRDHLRKHHEPSPGILPRPGLFSARCRPVPYRLGHASRQAERLTRLTAVLPIGYWGFPVGQNGRISHNRMMETPLHHLGTPIPHPNAREMSRRTAQALRTPAPVVRGVRHVLQSLCRAARSASRKLSCPRHRHPSSVSLPSPSRWPGNCPSAVPYLLWLPIRPTRLAGW